MAKAVSKMVLALAGTSGLALAAAGPAQAATAAPAAGAAGVCGDSVDGVVECTPDEGPFPAGVIYAAPKGDITVILSPDLEVAPDPFFTGVYVQADAGNASIDGVGSSIVTLDAGGAGGFAQDDLSIVLGTVSSIATIEGSSVTGIDTFAYGNTVIEVGSVSTTGDYSPAIRAQSTSGTITIRVDRVTTEGFSSDGIQVFAGNDASVEVGSIESHGDYNFGVNVMNGNVVDEQVVFGRTEVTTGDIAITGDNAIGVHVITYGDAQVATGDIAITGEIAGTGVAVLGLGNLAVVAGDVVTTGENGTGVVVNSLESSASAAVGDVTAERGGGVFVSAGEGDASLTAGTVVAGGDFGLGVGAASMYGNVTIAVGDITATGNFSGGINANALYGSITATAGDVATEGDVSHAVRIYGGSTDTRISGSLSTTGNSAIGLLNATTLGDAYAQVTGSITTVGDYATGAWVVARYGTGTTLLEGPVETSGDRAHGVHVTAEDGQLAAEIGTVRTSGALSDAVHARTQYVEIYLGQRTPPEGFTFTGDIMLEVADAAATGDGSKAVSARGIGAAQLTIGSASSRSSNAIEADMIGNVDLALTGLAQSSAATAVFLRGDDIAIDIGSGAAVRGALEGIVIDALGTRCVLRNPEDGVTPNPCPNPGDDYLFGNAPTPSPAPLEGVGGIAAIANHGVIAGAGGYALRMINGTLELANFGTISGGVLLGAGDDNIVNAGTFIVSRSSDFGAGIDSFTNSGTIGLAPGSEPASYAFSGLENFANSGAITLANGMAGDTLRIGGAYAGSGDAVLELDIGEGGIDVLVIDGAATGTTQVVLTPGQFSKITGGQGLLIVDAGAGSEAGAFVIAGQSDNAGFVRNTIAFAGSDFRLVGSASDNAWRQLGVVEAVEDASAFVLGGWRGHVRAGRDGASEAGSRLWGSLETGRTDREWSMGGSGSAPALADYRARRTGGQVGYDIAGSSEGTLRVGALARYTDSKVEFAAGGDTGVETLGGGFYANYGGERIVASVLLRYDHHAIESGIGGIADRVESTADTLALDAELGLRIAGAKFFVKPRVGIGWSHTLMGDVLAGAQRIVFDDADGLRGRVGVRFGTAGQGAGSLRLYGDVGAVHDFGSDYSAVLTAGGSEALVAGRGGTFAEGTLGIGWDNASGFGAFAEAQGETGAGRESLAGRVGFRLVF